MEGAPRTTNFIRRFTTNNEERHALLVALYNTTLFSFVAVSLLGLFALYKMLYMFLAPMMWAVLVGTVLFPLKRTVTQSTNGWLNSLEKSETPLLIGVLLLPYRVFVNFSDFIYSTATGPYGLHSLIAYVLLKILCHEGTFLQLIRALGAIYEACDYSIRLLSRAWVFPLIIVYAAAYIGWILLQERERINKKLARTFSLPIWVYAVSVVAGWFGPLRVVIFGGSAAALALISAGLLGNGEKEVEESKEEEKEPLDTPVEKTSLPSLPSLIEDESVLSGNDLLKGVSAMVGLIWVAKRDYALILVLVPLLFALIRHLGESFGIKSALCDWMTSHYEKIGPSVSKILNITVAGPLREFVKMIFSSDHLVLSKLRSQMHVLSSLVVMILLAIGSLSALIFVLIQVHGETLHLARLTSNVMSSRPDWLSSALNYTEGRLEEQNIDIDDYVEKGYQQARVWLATNVRSLADPKDPQRAEQLEKQVMQMVDNIYQMWEERNAATEIGKEGQLEKRDWITQMRSAADLAEMKEEIKHIVKDNIDTLLGVAHSIWGVFVLNVSLLSSLILSFTSIILSFGLEMLNLFIELVSIDIVYHCNDCFVWIVFLTMVYYLLASSGDRWLPLDFLSQLGSLAPSGVSGNGHGFTTAIENSIFGVFGLSFKMALFYGLYTYAIHTLFDLNIVFVPSVLASLFAAIPIMAPWTVCVVGVIELWLVRAEGASALVFTVFSFAPLAFADGKFYSEVKGVHPYLTGLSVIGGMYWLGLQGALIGPIILCCFLVLIHVSTQFTKVTTTA